MNEQEEIKKHIQECKTRIYNIRSFMKWNKDGDIEKCKENISIIETVIDALEKQIPKKVDATGNDDSDFYICPVCKERIEPIDAFILLEEPYCSNCGQKLDWGD